MRVALVCPYDLDVPGGVQSHVLHLAEALRTAGDDVSVIGPGARSRGDRHAVGHATKVAFNDSVAPIALDPRVITRVRRTLRSTRPDVVHVHEPLVPLVSLAATLTAPAPVVGTFHAWSDRDRAYRLARRLAGRALSRIDAFLAVSTAAASYHAGALGRAAGSFQIVPNGVDVRRFATAEPFSQMQGQDSLLFVGRLEPRKGLDQLIKAFIKLKVTRPGLVLYVVGDGPDRDRCQQMLPPALRPDVIFLGRVEQEELPRFYRSCTIYVAPALGGESFGIVLIEALSAGATVVASDIPGYASVLTDGEDGRLVPPGDPSALAEAIGALLDHPTSAAALAQAGRVEVERYDWSAVAAQAQRVYRRVAAETSK